MTGTITLTSASLPIGANVTISGPGAANLAISGNSQFTVFQVDPGVTAATISGVTIENGVASPSGGGINNQGTLTVSNSTLSGNSASNGGGIGAQSGTLILKSTLLAGQSSGGNCYNGTGSSPSSDGYNLSDDSTCSFLTQTGDQNNSTTARLSPSGLQNNGGPTQTIALLSTSSAVDAIPPSACTDAFGNLVSTDQRGIARPQGSGCDIGT